MTHIPEPDGRNPFNRASSLKELLVWDDLDFVRCAYVTVLGRQPDPLGQAHFVEQIRAGYSKLDLLWRLRRSREAKTHNPGIAGFDRALKRAAWERRTLLGMFARLRRIEADRDSSRDRLLRALLNATTLHQRSLKAVGERLSGQSVTSWSGVAAPASLDASQILALGLNGAATYGLPSQTPELDHLRKKAMHRRSTDGLAP